MNNNNNNTIRFMSFANNLPLEWIKLVWKYDSVKRNELTEKWEQLNNSNNIGGILNFFKFFTSLSTMEKNELLDWINSHYKIIQ